MFKKIIVFCFLLITFFVLSSEVKAENKENAYKAIVKIKTFGLDEKYKLNNISSGSGVIIDKSGIVLTNYHVISQKDNLTNKELETVYSICLTEDVSLEPNCSFTAQVIAKDEDLDLALLKINSISGYSNVSVFPYLSLGIEEVEVSSQVTALGYPEIGGNTLTTTQGIISGKENKYNKEWLKIDAITSFGNSGGAAIDDQGNLLGITSAAHSDFLASLGYVIKISSVENWINNHKQDVPQTNSLYSRAIEMIKKSLDANNSNIFNYENPDFSVTRPTDWEFNCEDENDLIITDNDEENSGIIEVKAHAMPYITTASDVSLFLKASFQNTEYSNMISIKDSGSFQAGDNLWQKKEIELMGESMFKIYALPVNNYIIIFSYDYGENDQDKVLIEEVLSSIIISETNNYIPDNNFVNSEPVFSLKSVDNWKILAQNLSEEPVLLFNPNFNNTFLTISVQELDEDEKGFTNTQTLEDFVEQFAQVNSLGFLFNYSIKMTASQSDYYLNSQFPNIIALDYAEKSMAGDKTFSLNRSYTIKLTDVVLDLTFSYIGDNEEEKNKILSSALSAISTLSLSNSPLSESLPTLALSNANNDKDNKEGNEENENNNQKENENEIEIKNKSMYNNLKGKIILTVEDKGQAYYISPSFEKMYSLGRPEDAFSVMREQGVGISNDNLNKIAISLDNLSGEDSDGDGLSDMLEDSIGTDKNKQDTDGDSYSDREELQNNYNPLGEGKLNLDTDFKNKQKGKIFLQVEKNGEAWYISPEDGKRHFLGRPNDAFSVMRNQGLGISNDNFDSLK